MVYDVDIYTNRVPGSLYAICRVHQDVDDFNEWRARSHACCVYFLYFSARFDSKFACSS